MSASTLLSALPMRPASSRASVAGRALLAVTLSLVAFGLLSFDRLPLREYPNIDPPIVTVDTIYPGAAANVVENRITELIEDRISGIEGIRFIASSSEDGRSRITVEFDINRDIDAAGCRPGLDLDHPFAGRVLRHRVCRVSHQVQQHLEQKDPVSSNGRDVG